MLLFPAIVLALAGILGVFQLGLVQLALDREAFMQARQISMGKEASDFPGISIAKSSEGKWVCVTAEREVLFRLEAKACLLKHGL